MSFLSSKNLFIFLILFSLSTSDPEKVLKPLKLEATVKGKMDENESREYFELKLPEKVPQGSLLVFTVKENRKGIREGEEIFSDPDIYVSKSNRFPSNREEASWYSERYGNDILTIPSYAVEPNEVFYVCMYCQYKCRYELNSYLSKEAPAEIGKYYDITLSKRAAINYVLYVPENPKEEELNVVANNPSLKNFRIFMAKEYPSSQNTFQIIPSWEGGYTISVSKYNKDYCTNCYYHILFQTEEDTVKISFTAYFQNTLSKINAGNIINDVVKAGSKRCYYFDTSIKNNLYDEKLVLNLNLFSGNVILGLNGWKPNIEERISSSTTSRPYSYNIENDKIILLQKKDFDYFDNDLQGSTKEKNFYFCIHGQQMASYVLSINFLSEVESLQRYNHISPGSEITGYLQGGQVTKYSIMDFNFNKNSIITLTFTQLEGRVEFFSGFCKEECEFNDEILKNKLQLGEITLATEISATSGNKKNIVIKPEDNKCYKQTQEDQIKKCQTLALIKCFGNSNDICSFKILPSINDQAIFMSPKKTYYNLIAKGKIDLYEILVTDEEVNSIVVVLTSVTGDAELQVQRIDDPNSAQGSVVNTGFQSKISRNKDYIPDVVRITPNLLGAKSVVGKYTVKITAASFSSYNLYYYTTRIISKDESPSLKDITLSLSEGNIIKDYFPNDIEYKIFSYTPQSKEKEDIKIILTRINVHFSFKVYLDFSTIKYNYDTKNKYEDSLSSYTWASDHNNELTISKDDPNYSVDGPYYIVVTKDKIYKEDENEELNKKSLMSYYLGVTKRGLPFSLNEGVEHSETLTEKYDYQDYFYIHKDISNPFNLELNILNGEVDVFVNTKQITLDNLKKIYEKLEGNNQNNLNEEDALSIAIYFRLSIDNYASIELNRGYFERNCQKNTMMEYTDKTCYLYIYIVQSKVSKKYHRDSQYIITAKSSLNTGMVLLSGQVYNIKVREDRVDHFIIEEVKHRKGISINVFFKNCGGKVYAKVPNTLESGNNITYPDANNFDYIGVDTYMGKVVSIPPKVFDRINSNSVKLQILLSVFPDNADFSNAEYSISYGSEPKRISQNVPYQSFLSAGEMHYFTFYFDDNTENIYISLSNMNGDADMYLNYGNDKLPTLESSTWSSASIGHEYIDINIKDRFFKKRNLKSLGGYYTLLVVGYTETTYTLYISSHADKIIPLFDNIPVSCQCQIQGEKCYYRYNNVYSENNINNNINKNEIIFTTQYIYGNGKMYASIFKEQELTESRKKYQEFFPNENEYQFSNAVTGKRNYLKITAEGNKYSKDSLILLTYICSEKTDVEITAASLQFESYYGFIDPNRENMFYLKYNESRSYDKQEESIFNFYSTMDESLIYEIHAYMGSARVKIFTNESIYGDNNEIVKFDYNHIAEFNIKAERDEEFTFIKTYTESYFNSIKNNLIYNKNVYFKIKPMSDFGFYIQVNYDRTWITPPIGESKSYLINNKNQMYGYFDISPEFSNVEFSISLDEFIQKQLVVYVKTIVGEKDAKRVSETNEEEKLYHYEIPSQINCNYKGKSDEYIGAVNINLNNLPIIKEIEKQYKFIRALFAIEVKKNTFKKRAKQPYSNNNEINYEEQDIVNNLNTPNNNINIRDVISSIISPTTKITITITPGINNFKRIDLPQHTYYFSNTSLVQNYNYNYNQNSKAYDGNKEVKIYSLDKRSNEDKKMIIQIHVCNGKYNYKITKKIVDYDNNPNDIHVSQNSDEYGRSKYLIDNLKDKHIYLSIKSSQNPNECVNGKDANGDKCSNELSYLIYYYSLTDNEYSSKKQNLNLRSNINETNNLNEFKIGMTPLSGMDRFKNIREQENIEYNIFYTTDKTLLDKLDNICYLSQILSITDNPDFNGTSVNNISVIKNIELDEKNEYLINNLATLNITDKLFVNILARNLKTNELIAYVPLSVNLEKPSWGFKKFFVSVLIICLLILVVYITHDYLKAKAGEGYQFPNRVIEMGSVQSKTGGYQRINI